MNLRSLLPATAAVLSGLAIAAPVAAADSSSSQDDICAAVNAEGPMAILGPYGPLGDYGPNGPLAGQANPAAACGGAISFALPGQTVGSFVTSNLSLFGQSSGIPAG